MVINREIIAMDSLSFLSSIGLSPQYFVPFSLVFAAVIILHWAPQARFQFEQKSRSRMEWI